MSEHVGYVVKISEVHPHSNADRLQIATIFGTSVIVGLDVNVGDVGVYVPTDIQLSKEYCENNNLVRKKDENGNNVGGYLDPDKRNIRAMKLRGEKSDGLFMSLESLAYTGVTKFEVGEKIETLNGHEICCKYIPRSNIRVGRVSDGNRTRKHSVPVAPLFAEHVDTEQLAYNLSAFKPNDQIEITLKCHGTSGRTCRLPKLVGYKKTLIDKLLRKQGTPVYDWGYVTGTRRVVLNDFEDGGYYGNNEFRAIHAKAFEGKLNKGETVYYEVVGFTTNGTPIMSSVSNSKISDKAFTKQYGETTVFSYGCVPNPKEPVIKDWYYDEKTGDELPIYENEQEKQSDMYVYRMTMTNEDGFVVEYSPDFMRYRCEQMGVKCVPMLEKAYIPSQDLLDSFNMTAGEWITEKAEEYYDGPDPIGKTHVREGVVVRIVNRPKFCAYKHKNFSFKVIEGLAKDIATEPDMEEAQEVENI